MTTFTWVNPPRGQHVLTAVALSLSIFFAGISGKMEFFRNQIKALGLAAVIFVVLFITTLLTVVRIVTG